MKNLTKIFMAFVAVMLVSCIADTTTEPTVELGKVKTTIDLSFEGVKTHLGDKVEVEEGKFQYPLLWSAGDQIAVNGIASEPLAEEFDGKAGASFEIESNGELTYPRSIVYPAPAEGTGVTFPATQEYKAGNIADGVAPLYGYAAEAGDVITLQHLTGVLRFAVTGEATLASMTVKAATGALAGSFDIDCATGALTAQEDKTSSEISMSFGEGLALTETAQPIYIAVPAGNFGIIEATLTTTDGKKMAAKFDTEAKPIKAGVVREFKEFVFKENTSGSDVFEIYTIDDLKTFAQTAATASWKEAKLMAVIDMTGETWTPVENFTKVFDGNRGKDDAIYIKGLKAPLFGITGGTIKNLKLQDVAIVETERSISGSIACHLSAGGLLENCETSGTFEINNTTYDVLGGARGDFSIGCMVGKATDATITDCVNNIDLTVTSLHKGITEESTTVFEVGGIVASVINTSLQTLTGLTNHGDILFKANIGQYGVPDIGGIAGYAWETKFLNAYNDGTIEMSSDVTTSYTRLGGIVGDHLYNGYTEGCENHGAIEVAATFKSNSYIGGVIGQSSCKSIKTSKNYGKITCSNKNKGTVLSVAGIVGYHSKSTSSITNCENRAAIELMGAITSTYSVAGIVGYLQSKTKGTVKDCANYKPISISGLTNGAQTCLGGIIGYDKSNGTFSNLYNYADAALSYSGVIGSPLYVGGVLGYIYTTAAVKNASNAATITVSSAQCTASNIGGVIGVLKAGSAESLSNTGEVSVSAITYTGESFFAGVIGSTAATTKTLTNEGDITVSPKEGAKPHIGGVIGKTTGSAIGITNRGKVTFSGAVKKTLQMGGCIGTINNKATNDITNEATGVVEVTSDAQLISTDGALVGGAIGYLAGTNLNTVTNHAAVKCGLTIGSTVTGGVFVGGVIGQTAYAVSSIYNYGDVTFTTTENIGTVKVGGLVANAKDAINDSDVYCNVQAVNCIAGMITGAARSTADSIVASNCKIGGQIATTESEKKTWDDDTEDYIVGVSPDWNELNGTNYFNYIYGSVSWDGVENYDSCTWWSGPTE